MSFCRWIYDFCGKSKEKIKRFLLPPDYYFIIWSQQIYDTISANYCVTELAAEIYNEVKKENTLERLHTQEMAEIYENACVSTCSLVLAILYLEKIKTVNPEYVEKVAPSELFLVSLVCKFIHCICRTVIRLLFCTHILMAVLFDCSWLLRNSWTMMGKKMQFLIPNGLLAPVYPLRLWIE